MARVGHAPGLPWFRLHAEFATDPKIQLLAFEDQRHFVVILCAKLRGVLDDEYATPERRDATVARFLGLDPAAAAETRRRLVEALLVTDDWQPRAWRKRQYEDRTNAQRQARHRAKSTVSNARVTHPDTDTDTDTESDKKTLPLPPPAKARAKAPKHTKSARVQKPPDAPLPANVSTGLHQQFPKTTEGQRAGIRDIARKLLKKLDPAYGAERIAAVIPGAIQAAFDARNDDGSEIERKGDYALQVAKERLASGAVSGMETDDERKRRADEYAAQVIADMRRIAEEA